MASDQKHSDRYLKQEEETEIMNIIVAVDKNWAIGKDNKLLVSIRQT